MAFNLRVVPFVGFASFGLCGSAVLPKQTALACHHAKAFKFTGFGHALGVRSLIMNLPDSARPFVISPENPPLSISKQTPARVQLVFSSPSAVVYASAINISCGVLLMVKNPFFVRFTMFAELR